MDKVFDRVKVASATTGTGSLTLGAADTGYLTFAQAGAANGDTVAYVIEDGAAFEIGFGVYNTAGPTLNRNVIASSNANALIVLTGNQRIFSAVQKRLFDGKLSLDGGTMTGKLNALASAAAAGAGFSLGVGIDPTNPVNGDLWINATDMKYRINGVTYTVASTAFVAANYVATASFTYANLGGKPTTVAGYGITDALTTSYLPTLIVANDTRTADDTPSTFATWKGLRLDFKNTAIGGLTGFHGALTVAPWSDDSGGSIYQLNFAGNATPDLYLRSGTRAGGWGSQWKLWHQNNFDPTTKIDTAQLGAVNGVATLDGTGKLTASQLPASVLGAMSYQGTWDATANSPVIPAAAAGNKGYFYKVATAGTTSVSGITDWQIGDWIVSNGASWDKIDNTDQISSVAGKTGVVTLVKGDVGLGNVDNTSDVNKPVSTAQQTALDAKQNKALDMQTITSAATVTPTATNDLILVTALAVAATLAAPSGTQTDGHGLVVRIKDNGTARALTFAAVYRAVGVVLPTTTVAGKTLYLGFIWNAADAVYDCIAVQQQ